MRPSLALELKQSTRLVVTPQLKQAIELLQMSTPELDAFLQAQVAANPMFDITSSPLEQPVGITLAGIRGSTSRHRGLDDPRESCYPAVGDGDPRAELLLEISLSTAQPAVKRAAAMLLDSLDSRGYLPEFTAGFARAVGCSHGALLEAQKLLQGLGPPGFGTQTLKECIALQLQQRKAFTPTAEKVVREYLPLLGTRAERVAMQANIPLAEMQAIIEEIRACDPCPGSRYVNAPLPAQIIPDVYIVQGQEGFAAYVNQSFSSRVVISDAYRRMAEQMREGETKRYLEECMRSALWLVRAVEQRRETLLRITQAIIRAQAGFLKFGAAYLRPLTLATIAAEVGVHESTVSRAIAHKHALTPRGMCELRSFFDSGVESAAGGIAAGAVKERLAKLISAENKARPLSDEQLAGLLRREGISISRRTVAKYRESLRIASSAGRRSL